jgi:FkbM family methyltransferase
VNARRRLDIFLHERKLALARAGVRVAAPPARDQETLHVGTGWGGWSVVPELLSSESVVYSAGIGEDSTFDEGLIERFGCEVHGFDPTPKGRAHGEALAAREPRFQMHPVGVWDEDTVLSFFAPRDPSHDSWSALNLQRTDESVDFEVRRVPSLMRELGHERIDLLKIDVEGAEYRVLSDVLSAGLSIPQIAVEFDEPPPDVRAPGRMARRLVRAGYRLAAHNRTEFAFVKASR